MISGNLTEIATLLWAPHTITTAVGYIAHMFHMLSLGHLFPVLRPSGPILARLYYRPTL